jgi:hypothetical protein
MVDRILYRRHVSHSDREGPFACSRGAESHAGRLLSRQHAERKAIQHVDLRGGGSAHRAGRDAIFMSREDAARLGLADGDRSRSLTTWAATAPCFPRRPRAGNLQVMWPEGNVIIRRGVVDKGRRRSRLQCTRPHRTVSEMNQAAQRWRTGAGGVRAMTPEVRRHRRQPSPCGVLRRAFAGERGDNVAIEEPLEIRVEVSRSRW